MTRHLPSDPEKNDDSMDPVTFDIEEVDNMFTGSGVRARLLRNGEPVGLVHLKYPWELHWLKKQIAQTVSPEDEGYMIVDPPKGAR